MKLIEPTVFCYLLSIAPWVAAEQPRLLHDPFVKPQLKKIAPEIGAIGFSNTDTSSWLPRLMSTLRAGNNSMVIVNSQVVKLGSKIDGFKLIEVNERSAVFLKQQKRIRLSLDDEK